ncbi:ABC transporter ATP-binding protein [Oceanicola sp. D3]|uniref:ABC transporter ATP-binding protein n=1 Tax=Oceanicola sp. D3 TaxID=2587163 RepID=UPI0011212ED5|nr:ABC transporter ATP-binding protein [Oceanicola sp. D3]QDC07888.1 ABC transporter ATP-binding protein [Oceanicola sp. D3]
MAGQVPPYARPEDRKTTPMYDLSCTDLTKKFGTFTAVSDVSLDIPSGSFFSILGPSGCGKTTLMRMIAGFESPTAGDIRIKGESVLNLPPNRRNVKMVFQHLALFPMMSVGENIAYGLRCRGEPKSEIAGKVARVLDRVGLPGTEDKKIEQLSGGQKQRIAIARCMVLEPDVLLLDEPLGALDLKLRERMKIELKQLQHQFETTFLYITHDQSEALVMSDNVAVMNAGRFEQIGAPKELYDAPASGFVAGFVGDATVLAGKLGEVKGGEGRVVLEGGGEVIGTVADGAKSGDAVEVFLRPEALSLGAGAEGCTLKGTVDSLLFNGAASRILVRAGNALIEVADPEQRAGATEGGTTDVSWAPDRARIFTRRPGA